MVQPDAGHRGGASTLAARVVSEGHKPLEGGAAAVVVGGAQVERDIACVGTRAVIVPVTSAGPRVVAESVVDQLGEHAILGGTADAFEHVTADRGGAVAQVSDGGADGGKLDAGGAGLAGLLSGHGATVADASVYVNPKTIRVAALLGKVDQIRAEKKRRAMVKSLAAFARGSWGVLEPDTPLEWSWHHTAICDHIEWLYRAWKRKGTDRDCIMPAHNLIVNVPPGSLKSRIVSVCALAWIWLDTPAFRLIAISQNPNVAIRDADACRELVRSSWYRDTFRPSWTLRDDRDAISNYGNTAGGSRMSFGAGVNIVGLRADAVFNDDPNDPTDALSPTARASVKAKWARSSNRVNDDRRSFRVVIQQRCHADDLTGALLEQARWSEANRMGWLQVSLPTEFDPERRCVTPIFTDPRTEPGESLHPARYTPEVLAAARVALGSYGYSAQHDQNPSPTEGGMFDRRFWKFWRRPTSSNGRTRPQGCRTHDDAPARVISLEDMHWLAITVDASFKDAATSDRVGIQVWGGHLADRFLIRDATKVRGFNDSVKTIRALRAEFPRATKILVEDKANGSAIIETLTRETGGVVPIQPMGGKASRAFAVSPYVEGGNVYLPEGEDFLGDYVEEFAVFPNGKHDDRVDATTQLLIEYGVSTALTKLAAAYGKR